MSFEHTFVTYLEGLSDNRGALAALRRGLGQSPGSVPDMHRYVIQFIPDAAYLGSWTEGCFYLMASLYALHPESKMEGNLGSHFRRTLDPSPDHNVAIERRFNTLLVSHADDLHFYLRQSISFLRSKDVAINWHQLMWDVLVWNSPEKAPSVHKRWAKQFWRKNKKNTKEP